MFGYKEFKDDVFVVFNNDDELKGFKVIGSDNSSVTYESAKCKFMVYTEGYAFIEITFVKMADDTSKKYYDLGSYLEFKYGIKNEEEFKAEKISREETRKKLVELKELMITKCQNILNGDFTWVNEFNDFLISKAKERWGDSYQPYKEEE
jgi:hypothetical protein